MIGVDGIKWDEEVKNIRVYLRYLIEKYRISVLSFL